MSAPLLCVCVGGVWCVYVGVWVSECSSLVCVCGWVVCGSVWVWGVCVMFIWGRVLSLIAFLP